MDIPLEAIGRGKEYPELIEKVEYNMCFIHGVELIREEWDLTAAMLGNQRSLSGMSYDKLALWRDCSKCVMCGSNWAILDFEMSHSGMLKNWIVVMS